LFLGFIKEGNLQVKFVYTRNKLLSRILDAAAAAAVAAAAGINKWKHQLRRTANDFSTRDAECIEGDGGI